MMQEFVQQIKETMQEFTDGVHTAVPGEVISFDVAKCEAVVKLSGQYKKPDGSRLDYPPTAHVPVVFPQVSGQQVTIAYPIKPGDGCLVVFGEQALEAWRAGGEANLDLKHDLTNAIAIPGLFRTPNTAMQEAVSKDAIVILNQGSKITVTGGTVEIETAKVEILAPTVNITGQVFVDGEVTVNGIAFTPHVHIGVKAGEEISGSPQGGA